jgi:hypothetical protein
MRQILNVISQNRKEPHLNGLGKKKSVHFAYMSNRSRKKFRWLGVSVGKSSSAGDSAATLEQSPGPTHQRVHMAHKFGGAKVAVHSFVSSDSS